MIRTTRFAAALALGASASMAAMPVAAAELPAPAFQPASAQPQAWESDAVSVERHRDYRGRYGRYHRHRGVRTGDVLAGVLILGGIAAVASAASKNNSRNRDRDYRDRDYRNRDYRSNDPRYQPRRGDSRYNGSSGIDNAVNICVTEIERDVRVEAVNSVDRNGAGWMVTGALYNGDGFACRIGNEGRIEGIDYGQAVSYSGGAQGYQQGYQRTGQQDRQWDDARYAQAWRTADAPTPQGQGTTYQSAPYQGQATQPAEQGTTWQQAGGNRTPAPPSEGQMPAYPGGPIDGDLETQSGG